MSKFVQTFARNTLRTAVLHFGSDQTGIVQINILTVIAYSVQTGRASMNDNHTMLIGNT